MTRVLVCGGRTFGMPRRGVSEAEKAEEERRITYQRDRLTTILDAAVKRLGLTEIIHGAAPGADTLASEWAATNGIPDRGFPAETDRYGKTAVPLRNQRMLDEGRPDLVIAFIGGDETRDMVERAKAVGLTVHAIDWEPKPMRQP
jgi:hypothetical protein